MTLIFQNFVTDLPPILTHFLFESSYRRWAVAIALAIASMAIDSLGRSKLILQASKGRPSSLRIAKSLY
jgi:hypothetical protein